MGAGSATDDVDVPKLSEIEFGEHVGQKMPELAVESVHTPLHSRIDLPNLERLTFDDSALPRCANLTLRSGYPSSE